nr:Gfo/Idh/MocA family oxidoreductase [uncultured Acetatifactor sp.]
MRNDKIVVCVIGCGKVSDFAHFPALSKNPGCVIKYACDLIPERARKRKEQYPQVEQVITDYHVALADSEVDAVYVLTPVTGHKDISIDALRAGKHVFCEKPISYTYEMACEMAREAEKAGKLLNIGVCNRYHRSVELLEQMNREGAFGKIYHVYCSFRNYRCIPQLGGAYTTRELSGGGVLIDWGIHFFDLIFYVLGGVKLETVTCDTYSEMAKDISDYKYIGMYAGPAQPDGINDVEEFVSGYMRTDKASISFNGAWAQNIDHDEMYIDFLGDKGGARLTYSGTFEFFTTRDGVLQKVEPKYEIPTHYEVESQAFFEAIRTGERTRAHISNILESQRVLDILYASASKREEIRL